jgi:hypothetical protein
MHKTGCHYRPDAELNYPHVDRLIYNLIVVSNAFRCFLSREWESTYLVNKGGSVQSFKSQHVNGS